MHCGITALGEVAEVSIEDLAKRLVWFEFAEANIQMSLDGKDRASSLIARLIRQEVERAGKSASADQATHEPSPKGLGPTGEYPFCEAWQPIETAPRDDEIDILCVTVVDDHLSFYAVASFAYLDDDGEPLFREGGSPATSFTHWMPLPKPPLRESGRHPKGGDADLGGSVHEHAVLEEHSPNLRSRTPTEAPDHD